MKHCTRCGHPAGDDAGSCEACGHPFPSRNRSQNPRGRGSGVGRRRKLRRRPGRAPWRWFGKLLDGAVKLVFGLIWVGFVSAVLTVTVISFSPVANLFLRPLVCPAGSKEILFVVSLECTKKRHTRDHTYYYCVDRNGAPRYVSKTRAIELTFLVVLAATVLVGLGILLFVAVRRRSRAGAKAAVLLLSGMSLAWSGCTSGDLTKRQLRKRFKGYLWTRGGQLAFKEDLLAKLGSRAHRLRNLRFRGTLADLVVGPGRKGKSYRYDLGRLKESGHGPMPHPSPCLVDVSRLDPDSVPRAVARARQEAGSRFRLEEIWVTGPRRERGGICSTLLFHVR